jgi:hypothetical protein
MMTGTGGSVNNKDAEDVLLIQEVLTTVINEWDRKQGSLFQLLVRGTWESSVPNIELAMMQLIHSRKAWKQTPFRNYRNSQYSGRGVYHQRIQHIQPR